MTTEHEAQRHPVEQLAEEFLARYRRGERPALSEYVRAHPELADEIRELFPGLVLLEEAGPSSGGDQGPQTGPDSAAGGRLERLGDYRIVREIGRGGMGVVYEAEQETLGRHVALKVLPFQSAAHPVRLQRFRREARAAARLHHTNIVPVFDVGEHQGTHYFAMQYIRGHGLDEVLRELRRLRAGASVAGVSDPGHNCGEADLSASLAKSMVAGRFAALEAPTDTTSATAGQSPPTAAGVSTVTVAKSHSELSGRSDAHYYRSVARVALQAAEALVHAHGHNVLHRDIKPSNLLLDLEGRVWVTDFGLAKDEGADLTRSGEILGTVRYMAPERFQGEADARSDIYSLGLTLYELLTLRPAFDETDHARLLKSIAHDEPSPPSRVNHRVPRDLETVVLKAMAKEPGRRYQTATDLAEDLRRFLSDRPVLARRTGAVEQTWRWCRRNRAAAALITISAAVVVALVASAFWYQGRRLDAARQRAVDEQAVRQGLDHVRQTLEPLHANLKQRGGVHALLNQPGRWQAALHSARGDCDRAHALADHLEPALDPSLREQLRELDDVLARDESDLALASKLEVIRLAHVTTAGGKATDFVRTANEYAAAFQSVGIPTGRGDEAEAARVIQQSAIRDELVASLDAWAWAAHRNNDPELIARLLHIARLADPDPWRDRVRDPELWKNRADMLKLADEVQNDRAVLSRLGPATVLVCSYLLPLDQAETWLRQAQAIHPADFWINYELANVLKDKKDNAEAISFYRVALALRPNSAAVYNNLGTVLRNNKNVPAAIDAFRTAVDLDPQFAPSWHNLGLALATRNEWPAALDAYDKALKIDPSFAPCWNSVANARLAQKDLAGAIKAYERATEADPTYMYAWANLGDALTEKKDYPAAVAAFHKALALAPKNARLWYNFGVSLRKQNDLPAAIAALEKAVAVDPRYVDGWNTLGSTLRANKDLPAAVEAFKKALSLDGQSTLAWANLGNTLRAQKDYPAAIAALEKAVAIDPKFASAWNDLGSALQNAKKFPAAIEAQRKAVVLDPENGKFHCSLGLALRDHGDLVEALTELETGHRLGSRTPGWAYPSQDWIRETRALLEEKPR